MGFTEIFLGIVSIDKWGRLMTSESATKVRAVLFDFDGTLFDLNANWLGARKRVVQTYLEYGVPTRVVMRYLGPLSMYSGMYDKVVDTFSPEDFAEMQLQASKVLERYEMQAMDKATRMNGCPAILRHLKSRGVKVGIISLNGKRVIRGVLKKTGSTGFIDALFTRDSPGRPKPYPDHILNCLNILRCKPRSAIMVGDGVTDMLAAKRAGILSVGIPKGIHPKEELRGAGANKTIENLHELTHLLEI